MKIMNRLTLRYLLLNRRRTVITLVGVIVSVAMITAVAGFSLSFLSYIRQGAIAQNGEWHVFYTTDDRAVAEEIAESDLFDRADIVLDGAEDGGRVYTVRGYTDRRLDTDFLPATEALADEAGVGLEYNSDLLRVDGLFASNRYNTTVLGVAGVLIAMIMGASILVVANAFSISAAERTMQYGVLKSVGATRRQVRGSVLFEGTAIALVAIPLGLLAGYIGEAVVLRLADSLLGELYFAGEGVHLRAVVSLPAFGAAAVLSYVTIMLSAWLPARKTSKVSPVDAIRRTGEVSIRPGRVRTSRLTSKVFGFEGALAAKALKRSRGKYRATVVSLTVSIVLFMGATSFGNLMNQSVSMAYTEDAFPLMVYLAGGSDRTWQEQQEALEALAALPGVEDYGAVMSTGGTIPVNPDLYSRDGLTYVYSYLEEQGETETNLSVVALSDREMDALGAELGLDADDLRDTERYRAILINTVGPFYDYDEDGEARLVQIAPYRGLRGTDLTMTMYEDSVYSGSYAFHIAGELDRRPDPLGGSVYQFDSGMTILVTRAVLEDILLQAAEGEFPEYQSVYIQTEDVDGYIAALEASDILREQDSYFNFEASNQSDQNVLLIIRIFVYGFVVLLSLIAVTSVIGTISTSIALRRREFATLSSVGMTPEGFRKMLNLESLFYGLKSLAYGLPLGLLAAYGMYWFIGESLYFPFIWPWGGIAIVVAAVLLITFITMHYSRSRQKRDNIVDVLRMEMT